MLLALLAGCAAPHPTASEVLAPIPEAPQAGAPLAERLRVELDARASLARAEAARLPDDPRAQVAAAQALFLAADARVEAAALAFAHSEDPATGEALLAGEDRLPRAVAREVIALCQEGRALARRALELAPDDAAALHQVALHGALIAQAEGPARAAFSVAGLVRAMERTLSVDPDLQDGAPRVLYGRFRDRAPWPHQDREQALELLEAAVQARPTPARLLFLGDARFGLGDRFDDALAAWRAAATAPSDPLEDPLAPLYRARARERLAREAPGS